MPRRNDIAREHGQERMICQSSSASSGLSSRKHIAAFDGMRGVAVLAVVLCHGTVGGTAGKGLLVALVGITANIGWIGVDMFFALSGFLITGILLDTTGDPHYFRNFYVRRVLRIFPLYYGLLFALIALTPLLQVHWNGTMAAFLFYLENLVPFGRLTLTMPHVRIHLEHLWSLAIEEQFYLVWPALVWIFRKRSDFILVPIAVIVLCPLLRALYLHGSGNVAPITVYVSTAFRADALAWGALGAWLVRYRPSWAGQAGWVLLVLGAAVVVAVFPGSNSFDHLNSRIERFGFSALDCIFCGLLLRAIRPGSWLGAFFADKRLRWFGKYSYGIYVYHYLCGESFVPVRYWVGGHVHSKGAGSLAYLLCMLAFGTAAAYVSYNIYEKRWLRLKDKVARYSVQRPPLMLHKSGE